MAEALPAQPTRVAAALAQGRDMLADAGCDTPALDAQLLLAEVLGVGRERLVIDRQAMLPAGAGARFQQLLARRRAREPVAYILGRKEFRRITLSVDRRVLIPRPETELLVEIGLELPFGACVADVGTGSGAVALALKHERPDLAVRGLEIDPGALEVARLNAARLGVDVEFACADLVDDRVYDAVLANLPYVSDGTELALEIAGYEPAGALFGGPDGLAVVRRLIGALRDRPLSLVALEIGIGQAAAVGALLSQAGFGSVELRRDLAGHDRVVVGSR